MKNVTILGEGAWGSGLATLLAHNGFNVLLWCHDPSVAKTITTTRTNPHYLPSITFDHRITPTTDLEAALSNDIIFEAIPVRFLRSLLTRAAPYIQSQQTWVIASKGIEASTLLLPSQILTSIAQTPINVVILSGPSYAHDLALQQPTAVMLASNNQQAINHIKILVENHFFKAIDSTDMIGIQLCAAIKNVIALGIGLLHGAGYTDNTQCWALTTGFNELITIVHALAGNTTITPYGLAGFGDLILTSMGKHSKNRLLGEHIGKGQIPVSDRLPEGINTILSLYQLIKNHKIHAPFIEALHEVIINRAPIELVITTLHTSLLSGLTK